MMQNADEFLDEGSTVPTADEFLSQGIPEQSPTSGNANDYSAWGGFIQGARAPLDAGAQMLVHELPDSVVNAANSAMGDFAPTATQFDKQISDRTAKYDADRTAAGKTGFDWPYLAGNIAGSAPLAAAAPELDGAPLLAKAANVLAQGYGYGTLAPVTDNQKDFWGQKNKQGEIGAVMNGVFAPVAAGLSKVISPSVSDDVSTLMQSGVTPTPGQIMGGTWKGLEDKATSIPLLGDMIKNAQNRAANDLNTAVAQRALAPIGEKVTQSPGRSLVEEVSDKLGAAYNDLLPKLKFNPDQKFSSEVQKTAGMAAFLPKQQAKQFNSIVGTQLQKLKNGADGQTLKGIESELTSQMKGYQSDASFDNRKLGDAIGEVISSIRGNLQRTNPQYADRLSAINNGYANYTILRKAASNLGASEGVGVFSPSQLQSAVKDADKSVAKGNFARGNARMQDLSDAALSVMGGKYPDSGTAGRSAVGLLAAGALGHINPIYPAAAFGAAAPYTKAGQNITANLLTKRPDFAPLLANAIQKSSPYIAAGAIPQFTPFALNGGLQ